MNEAVFRSANEEVRRVQRELDLPDGPMPFICECEDAACRAIVRATQEVYERIRAAPRRFLLAPGHSAGGERIVERTDAYWVGEKHGRAGRVAEETDPRQGRV